MDNSKGATGQRRHGRGKRVAPVVVEGDVAGSVMGVEPTAPKKAASGKNKPSPSPSSTREGSSEVPDVVVPLRYRNDGWVPIKQRAFLRGLSELGSVVDACKRVGMTTTSAYRLRGKSEEFAEAWDKAAQIVAPILEQAAYERGVEGWDEEVYQNGKLVGTKRRYSDAALKMLMQARKAAAEAGMTMPELGTATIEELEAFAREASQRAGGFFCTRKSQEEVDAALLKRLDDLAARRQSAARERGDVWLSGGGYPGDMRVADAAARAEIGDDAPDA